MRKGTRIALALIAAWLAAPSSARAQHGIVLSGGGPIQRSMGGTGTATALDSLGGLFWNPATLGALPTSELTFGAEFLMPHADLHSRVAPGTFGPGFPPVPLAGSTRSESGTMILPNVGWAHHLEESELTVGLGFISAAGLASNYPGSLSNPVLTPPPPVGLGLGRAFADLQVFQIVPAASFQVTEELFIGAGPIINMASLRASPLLFAAPDDANGNGFPTYPDGTRTRLHWGAGFQVGLYYMGPSNWNFGASFKSPQWFETFRFQSADEVGRPREERARFDLPWIASVGVSYTGIDRWLFAGDVRFIDYHNTEGFDESGFTPTGAVRGLGWDSQVVVAVGAQYQVTDCLSLRTGYSYNNNPQDAEVAFINMAAPTIIEHTLYAGASWNMTEMLVLSVAYVHGFESTLEGPIITPLGIVPGSAVRSSVSADAFVMGLTAKY